MTETAVGMGFEAKIAPELQQYVQPLDGFSTHPENVRKHRIEKIAQSLERHGQRALIIVQQSTGHIVKGNGTYTAAQMLGWTKAAFLVQEMSDEDALAFLYADNRASDLATYDRRKLRDGLAKMIAGPGIFDTLWEAEEFEDLDEEMNGERTMDAQPTDAAYADAGDKATERKERAALPGEKMREVPLVLTIADHAVFVEGVKKLQKVYGTGGTIATVAEAIRRQATAEGTPVVGRALTEDQEYLVRRALVKELRDYILTFGPERSFSATWVVAQLEKMVPYRPVAQPAVAEGQVEMMEGVEAPADGSMSAEITGDDTGTSLPPIAEDDDPAEAMLIARVRAYDAALPEDLDAQIDERS